MYAVIDTGGKHFKVEADTKIKIEKIDGELGSEVKFDKIVTLVKDDDSVVIGTPYVEGATVNAKIVSQRLGKKVIAFHYKPKKRIRTKRGHRQPYTMISITGINA